MFFDWKWRKAPLVYPAPGPRGVVPPVAVLVPWVRSNGVVRVFPQGWDAETASFTPAAIAGSWPQLEALLPVKIPSLTHAIIVLARHPGHLLTQPQRERLWQAFRVPVFEQILDENGALLAGECEAHDGLHIESAKLAVAPEWMDTAICGCGRKTPRLRRRTEGSMDALRAVAAYAR